MSFPLSPANNQVTLENGISYTYNASRGAWFRTPATALASLTSNTFTVLNSIIFWDLITLIGITIILYKVLKKSQRFLEP